MKKLPAWATLDVWESGVSVRLALGDCLHCVGTISCHFSDVVIGGRLVVYREKHLESIRSAHAAIHDVQDNARTRLQAATLEPFE